MREIKFRGRALYDSCGEKVDKLVIGDLSHEWNKVTIFDENDGDVYEVDPNSVAQLVGLDSDGHEVYEGDTLIHASGEEWIAALGSYARNKTGLATYNFKKLTLKEAIKS